MLVDLRAMFDHPIDNIQMFAKYNNLPECLTFVSFDWRSAHVNLVLAVWRAICREWPFSHNCRQCVCRSCTVGQVPHRRRYLKERSASDELISIDQITYMDDWHTFSIASGCSTDELCRLCHWHCLRYRYPSWESSCTIAVGVVPGRHRASFRFSVEVSFPHRSSDVEEEKAWECRVNEWRDPCHQPDIFVYRTKHWNRPQNRTHPAEGSSAGPRARADCFAKVCRWLADDWSISEVGPFYSVSIARFWSDELHRWRHNPNWTSSRWLILVGRFRRKWQVHPNHRVRFLLEWHVFDFLGNRLDTRNSTRVPNVWIRSSNSVMSTSVRWLDGVLCHRDRISCSPTERSFARFYPDPREIKEDRLLPRSRWWSTLPFHRPECHWYHYHATRSSSSSHEPDNHASLHLWRLKREGDKRRLWSLTSRKISLTPRWSVETSNGLGFLCFLCIAE